MANGESDTTSRQLPNGLLVGLCRTYAELLRRQRNATTPFARWSRVTSRAHDFVWIGGIESQEILMSQGQQLMVRRDSPLFDAIQKMHATATLNPYEREILYGYPYVVGRRDRDSVRGPILTIPIRVETRGDGFAVCADDDVVRFNSLPFRGAVDSAAHALAIARVIEATPMFPVGEQGMRAFAEALIRELRVEMRDAHLDGRLVSAPNEPRDGEGLWLVDQAALFVAPKTSYFLTSDLESIAEIEGAESGAGALLPLLAGAGGEAQAEFSNEELDGKSVYFPFPSNRSQRRTALLVDDPTTRLIRVEGPPGTGKSLTIANLACHLAATGRTVLITSQKDKALRVVDEKLRELALAELPMTLLRHDKESKRELISRLQGIKKDRGANEVEDAYRRAASRFSADATQYVADANEYARALECEDTVHRLHRGFITARGLRRLARNFRFRRARSRARRIAPRESDAVAESARSRRHALLSTAVEVLQIGRERAISIATRQERQGLRELSAVLKRDQNAYKNFSLFDRLKQQPERAEMLLKLLPIWIMTPDDAARLFPCRPGIFDVIIVDEASQVDLPSITPIVYRGKKLVTFGDSKQMQPRRFAFMNVDLSQQLWQQHAMDRLDPDRWLYPSEQSLLSLATIRAEEENLLDEHFRSLPPIIRFSNERWYEGRLRIMTDERHKRFGAPDQPIMQLHQVVGGGISNRSQENEVEARALVDFLLRLIGNPDYAGASFGVMCLFEEQVALVQELVADRIDPKKWAEHDLTVINPDGFQGDERDVILYSLSYDGAVMPRAAITARMADQAHVQGMLNVAFTRARDEVHVFHTAPIKAFTFADGRHSALTEWLIQCAAVQATPRIRTAWAHIGKVDSQFEGDVAAALRERGVNVIHQYPACGFKIDLVCEREGVRIAVECDGERFHTNEHGQLKADDLERQAILERAGWRVVRVPYRKWIEDTGREVQRIMAAFVPEPDPENDDGGLKDDGPRSGGAVPLPSSVAAGRTEEVTDVQAAILDAVRSGLTDEEGVLRHVREKLGYQRIGVRIRASWTAEARALVDEELLAIEDREYFATARGRSANLRVVQGRQSVRGSRRSTGPRRKTSKSAQYDDALVLRFISSATYSGQAARRSESGVSWLWKRSRRASRSARVNFHSKGAAICS